jgi:hypothetical protein
MIQGLFVLPAVFAVLAVFLLQYGSAECPCIMSIGMAASIAWRAYIHCDIPLLLPFSGTQ